MCSKEDAHIGTFYHGGFRFIFYQMVNLQESLCSLQNNNGLYILIIYI